MTIDRVAKEVELLTKYEAPKVNILRRLRDGMRVLKAAGDREGMKKEMDVFLNILGRIDAVIPGEMARFNDNKKIIARLENQRMIIRELTRYAAFYKNQVDIVILNNTYNKMSEAITSFITLSESMINIKSFKNVA